MIMSSSYILLDHATAKVPDNQILEQQQSVQTSGVPDECKFCVANGSGSKVAVRVASRNPGDVDQQRLPESDIAMQIAPGDVQTFRGKLVFVTDIDTKSMIYGGPSSRYKNRALIVTSNMTVNESIEIDTENPDDMAWRSDINGRMLYHYPKAFVANASRTPVRVRAFDTKLTQRNRHSHRSPTRSAAKHPSCSGSMWQEDGELVEPKKYISFQGHYIEIYREGDNSKPVYEAEVRPRTSLIVYGDKGVKQTEILATDDIDRNVWIVDGKNYNPEERGLMSWICDCLNSRFVCALLRINTRS